VFARNVPIWNAKMLAAEIARHNAQIGARAGWHEPRSRRGSRDSACCRESSCSGGCSGTFETELAEYERNRSRRLS